MDEKEKHQKFKETLGNQIECIIAAIVGAFLNMAYMWYFYYLNSQFSFLYHSRGENMSKVQYLVNVITLLLFLNLVTISKLVLTVYSIVLNNKKLEQVCYIMFLVEHLIPILTFFIGLYLLMICLYFKPLKLKFAVNVKQLLGSFESSTVNLESQQSGVMTDYQV